MIIISFYNRGFNMNEDYSYLELELESNQDYSYLELELESNQNYHYEEKK